MERQHLDEQQRSVSETAKKTDAYGDSGVVTMDCELASNVFLLRHKFLSSLARYHDISGSR
jgi:hypothetical protein